MMKMNLKIKKVIVLLIATVAITVSCSDQDDNLFAVPTDYEIQDFIWKGLNTWYFWQGEVADLSDSKDNNSNSYISFLASYPNPADLFEHLKHPDDRFSVIVSDYEDLQNSQAGTSETNGVDFRLIFLNDSSSDVIGYVRYIIPGSDAAGKDIRRGDVFYAIDGQPLYFNSDSDNNLDLLDPLTHTLNLADLTVTDGVRSITPNGRNIELTKSELTENPILVSQTLDVDGQKIGYLMYNQFVTDFDTQLNNAFGAFQADGVSDLVLDLRYNPGGFISSARDLASMITGQFTGQLFTKFRYNDKIQDQLSDSQVNRYFNDQLSNGSAINSLNLNRVFVLTTGSTASASELVINSLTPYIDVVQIGTTTTGKNEASITVYDSPSWRFDDDQLNPNHTWAMQPLISRLENSVGFSNYIDGLAPDVTVTEDLTNLGVLGNVDEPLLAAALAQITGSAGRINLHQLPIRGITDSKLSRITKNNMYLDIKLDETQDALHNHKLIIE